MKRESDEMRGARLQREREMEKFQPPGWNSKTKVFIWETMGGHQIRRKVTTAFADRMWDEFDKATMRHNAFRNEWDLWTVHDPSRPCPIDDEEGEDNANSNLESLNDNLQALYIRDALATIGSAPAKRLNTEAGLDLCRKRPLQRMLSEWFGFHSTTELPNGPPKVQIAFDKHSWSRMLSFMMYTNSADPPLDSIRLLLAFYISMEGTPPELLSDLHGVSLSNFGNPQIAVRRTSYLAKQRNEEKAPTLALYSVQLLEGDYYGRRIFVWNASTALAIKRLDEQRSRSVGHIAEYLNFTRNELCYCRPPLQLAVSAQQPPR